MLKHLNIIISGNVQGVGFRIAAKKKADKLGVFGFAVNRPDGTVYMEAEGEAETVDALVTWCNKGPLWAAVTSVHSTEGEVKRFKDFAIRSHNSRYAEGR